MGVALSRQCVCVHCQEAQDLYDYVSNNAFHGDISRVIRRITRRRRRTTRDEARLAHNQRHPKKPHYDFPDEVADGDLFDSVPACLLVPRSSGPSKVLDLPPELLDMIAAYLSLKDIKACRLVSKAIGGTLLYELGTRCPQKRSYRQIKTGVSRLTRCYAIELRHSVRELSLLSANPTLIMPPSSKDVDLPRLQKLDLQGVRFAPHNNLTGLLQRHKDLQELRLCFVSLLRFEWWSEVLKLLRDEFGMLEKLTAVNLRYSRNDTERWLVLPDSEPERCESCNAKTWHKQIIDLNRHPDTNCEHTRTFQGRTNVRLALDGYFDADGKLERPEVQQSPAPTLKPVHQVEQSSRRPHISQTQRPMDDQWYELLGTPD